MEQLAMCYQFSDRKSVLIPYSGMLYLTVLGTYRYRFKSCFLDNSSIETDKPHAPPVYTHLDVPNV